MVISTPVEILLETLEEENRNPPTINLPMSFPSSTRSAGSIITIEEESVESLDEVDLNGPDSQSVFTRTSAEAEVQTVISMFDDDGPLASWKDEVPTGTETNMDLFIALEPRHRYVKCLFDIMFFTGFSRVNGNGQKGSNIQLFFFYFFAALSLFDAFSNVKQYMLEDIQGGMILHYTRLILFGNNFLAQAVFIKVMQTHELSEYLQTNLKSYIKFPLPEQKSVSKISIAILVIDIVMSFVVAFDIYLFVLNNWTVKEMFQLETVQVSRMLFQWERSNGTEHEERLWGKFGNDVTVSSAIMGISGYCYRVVGIMQKNFIQDLLLVLSLHLLQMVTTYLALLEEINSDQIDENTIKKMWKAYQYVHTACIRINNILGFVINLAHVQNLFFLATAMLRFINSTLDQFDFFEFGWRIIKIVITYGSCVMISYLVEKFKYWLNIKTEKAEETARNDQALKIEIMRINQRVEVSPIGLGNGTYRITESFVNRFIGVVASLFMLFAKPS